MSETLKIRESRRNDLAAIESLYLEAFLDKRADLGSSLVLINIHPPPTRPLEGEAYICPSMNQPRREFGNLKSGFPGHNSHSHPAVSANETLPN